MDDSLPDWLNNEFLTECLRKTEKHQGVEVTNYSVSPVVPPGNNYGSFIIRIKVQYKNNAQDSKLQQISLILKSELVHGAVKELLDSAPHARDGYLQQSEYNFYYKFLPKADKFTDTGFAPKSFFSPRNNVMVIEDLKEKGFLMADRTKLLDFNHCRLYMEAAASMHATSIAVYKEDPNPIESIGEEKMFSNDAPAAGMFNVVIKLGMKILADSAEEIERSKLHAKVIRDVAPLLWDALVDIHKPSKFINTINQGDPWTTNMMFRYDGAGNVCEVKLIDFQCLRYGSPLNDIIFLIWTSANNYVRSHKLDDLYQIYLETFNSKLKQFNCAERLTREHFNEGMKRRSPLVMFLVASMFPLLTHPDPLDFGKLVPKDGENGEESCFDYFKHYYNERFCKEQVPLSLEQLEKAGVFQHLESLIK